jgi:hypothetical protein
MKRMLTFLCLAAAAAGCDRVQDPVSPLTPKEAAKSSSGTSFVVQGITLGPSGQIYQASTYETCGNTIVTTTVPAFTVTVQYHCALDAGGSPAAPYNGGWINVYGQQNGSRAFLGQVPANLDRVYFDGVPNDASVVLEARGDAMQGCSFQSFDGYSYGQSSITVAPSGDLPLAHFQC